MKRIVNYIGLFILLLIPFNVFGISYTLEEPKKGVGGVTYIDIKVTGVSGLKQTEVLTCSTSPADKTGCEIEVNPDPKYKGKLSKEGNIIVSTEEFTENQVVGRLAIKNKTYEDVTTKALFEVNGSTYGNPIEDVAVGAATKPASSDSSITKITVSKGTIDPEFKADVTEYVVYDFPDTINKITFTYECDNCMVNGTSKTTRTISQAGLVAGENNIKLTSKSEDGTTTTVYTFTVLKGTSSYNSLKLKSLSIEGFELSPKFDASTKEYEVKVPKKVESIESLLKYETEDNQAKVKVDGAGTLDKDENEVKLTITNRTGETSEIKIKVIKEDPVSTAIEVIGYKDDKVSFINAEGVREELGKDEFKEKYPEEWKKIEDKTYQFDEDGNIIKEKNEDNKNSNSTNKKENKFPWIIVILIIVSLLVIGLAGFFIFRDPNKKKGKEEETKTNDTIIVEPIEPEAPTAEEAAQLSRIDTYDEEARIEAEAGKTEIPAEPQETVVQEATIDDYVDDDKTPTTDIDEALSDLMNTKEYNFKDKE